MSRKTKEIMYPLIKKWEQSECTKSKFCKIHGINITTFIYWEGKYKEEFFSQIEEHKFVTLKVSDIRSNRVKKKVEICYPNGVRIRFSQELPEDFLASLVKLVG